MNLDVRALLLAIAAVCLLPAAPAQATCLAPGFNPSGQFCNGCRYEGSMSTSRDEVCERPYINQGQGFGGRGPILQILGHRLVQRAQHGIAGVSGVTMAYAPGKGYVGKDEFTVEVDYHQGSDNGKFYVHWNVTVQ